MTIPLAYYVTGTLGTAAAATAFTLDNISAGLLLIAGMCGALAGIWKFFGITNAWRAHKDRRAKQATFYLDWYGEPARPGHGARPGIPESLAKLAAQYHEIKGRDGQLAAALEELASWAKENGIKIDRLDERMIAVDARVTDHRRRNDEQAQVLRDELEIRAAALETQLHARNDVIDERLATISGDLLRAETMRAALAELGIDIEPPAH